MMWAEHSMVNKGFYRCFIRYVVTSQDPQLPHVLFEQQLPVWRWPNKSSLNWDG